jgi:hypothetical protein
MARVDVSTSTDVEPSLAWKLASDLRRFDEWMTIFVGWCGTVPSTIEAGSRVSSLVGVKGFRNVIHWTVTVTTSRNQLSCRVAAGAGYGSRWQWT